MDNFYQAPDSEQDDDQLLADREGVGCCPRCGQAVKFLHYLNQWLMPNRFKCRRCRTVLCLVGREWQTWLLSILYGIVLAGLWLFDWVDDVLEALVWSGATIVLVIGILWLFWRGPRRFASKG